MATTNSKLDALDEQISHLEKKRKELLFEVEKETVRQKVLDDYDFQDEIHKGCKSEQDIENAIDDTRQEESARADTAWDYLETFGAHTAACLSGALAATQELHPLCTCGWNHVATEIEKA